MFANCMWRCLLPFIIIPIYSINGQSRPAFSMPDSVMLFAEPYHYLKLVGPDYAQALPPAVDVNVGGCSFPSILPKGDLIAWGFIVAMDPQRRRLARFALGVYFIAEQRWKTYGDFDDIGTTAFSPDGSRIAFVAEEPENRDALLILDIATGKMTNALHPKGIPQRATLSWSPDGKRLVVETQKSEKSSLIVVLDPNTGAAQPIGEGSDPAWSPTGEWIAYYDLPGKRCILIHPDGTGTKSVGTSNSTLLSYRRFRYAAVWSPDGKKLLVNVMKGNLDTLDVMLLDLETGRSTTKSKNGLPVFGWASRAK